MRDHPVPRSSRFETPGWCYALELDSNVVPCRGGGVKGRELCRPAKAEVPFLRGLFERTEVSNRFHDRIEDRAQRRFVSSEHPGDQVGAACGLRRGVGLERGVCDEVRVPVSYAVAGLEPRDYLAVLCLSTLLHNGDPMIQ